MTPDKIKFAFVTSLTIGRIPLILVFFIINLVMIRVGGENLVLGKEAHHALWFSVAFGAMVLSALTDLFDGYFARKFKMETSLGAYADPMTDKMFYLVSFPTLVFLASLEQAFLHAAILLALTCLFLFRDQWVSFLRSIGAIHNMSAKANWSGKARTVISFPSICAIYWYLMSPEAWQFLPTWFIYALEIVSLAINLISIYVYSRNYWPAVLLEMKRPPKDQ